MIVDNFKLLGDLLTFDEENKSIFYFGQLRIRKKDFPNKVKNNYTVLKSFFFDSKERFLEQEAFIKETCDNTGARAYINLSPKSYKDLTKLILSIVTDRVVKDDYKKPYSIVDSAAGQLKSKTPVWIVDIDRHDNNYIEQIKNIINFDCQPLDNNNKIISIVPTKHGYHLLTKPFNLKLFNDTCRKLGVLDPDVHKNNPTLLYFNDLEN